MAVRDSTAVGSLLMDAIDTRQGGWTVGLHRVPQPEVDAIVERARERGWAVEAHESGLTRWINLNPPEGGEVTLFPEAQPR